MIAMEYPAKSPTSSAERPSPAPRHVSSFVEKVLPVLSTEVRHFLIRVALPRGRDPGQERDDLVQEVALRLLSDGGALLDGWNPERGLGFESYLRLVCRQQAAMIFRSRRRAPWTETPVDPAELQEHRAERPNQEDRVELSMAIASLERWLDERGRRLFVELFVKERDVADVGNEFGLSRDAIYAWRRRVRTFAAGRAWGEIRDGGPSPRFDGPTGQAAPVEGGSDRAVSRP